MESSLKLLFSPVPANLQVHGRQRRMKQILDTKRISYELVDVTQEENTSYRNLVKEQQLQFPLLIVRDLPPMTFEEFEILVEDGLLEDFIQQAQKPHVVPSTPLIAP